MVQTTGSQQIIHPQIGRKERLLRTKAGLCSTRLLEIRYYSRMGLTLVREDRFYVILAVPWIGLIGIQVDIFQTHGPHRR
jgi:hypothetical protein